MAWLLMVTSGSLAQSGAKPSPQMTDALRKAVADPSARRDLRIETECQIGARRTVVQIYGSGVGIWQERAQFAVDAAVLRRMLEAFERHHFLSLAESYGGRRRSPARSSAQVLRVTCMVALALSAGEHHVAQIETGEQSEALKALASDIVALSEGPARLSTTIASAKEGLALIADGRLAPETLTLMAHFKALDGSGWIVEAQDGQLRSAPLDARAGYGSRKQLVQARAHILGLARTFDASGITSLPARLATADYTELQVQVLDKRSEVLARPLTGQSSPTPEQLQALMQIRAALDRMHRLVIKQGRNAP